MIEFKNVTKSFGDVNALNSISFLVERGTACGYIGPNGAGKTTTARIIAGLDHPDSGAVSVAGEAESRNDLRDIVGYVPESPKLYETLTPKETIALAAMLRRVRTSDALARLEIFAEILDFHKFLLKPLQTLSKGTKQKVVISLAIVFRPSVLVLDEPTDGLDVQAVVSLKQIIDSFTRHGGTVFYSSHLLDIVEAVCSKVYFINSGKLAGEYSKADFVDKRGYLESALIESIGTSNGQQLIDAFFENAL